MVVFTTFGYVGLTATKTNLLIPLYTAFTAYRAVLRYDGFFLQFRGINQNKLLENYETYH